MFLSPDVNIAISFGEKFVFNNFLKYVFEKNYFNIKNIIKSLSKYILQFFRSPRKFIFR